MRQGAALYFIIATDYRSGAAKANLLLRTSLLRADDFGMRFPGGLSYRPVGRLDSGWPCCATPVTGIQVTLSFLFVLAYHVHTYLSSVYAD